MEFNEKKGIYLQLAERFIERVLTQNWKTEERIPSIREMAIEHEVNPNTMLRTYNYLQEMGVIYNKRGLGYFVAPDGLSKAKELKKTAFINQELPQLIQTMKLLEMNFEDLKKHLPS